MKNGLEAVLANIGESYRDQIGPDSRNYVEVDIGKQAEQMGYRDIVDRYSNVFAIVPLKSPVHGMKVRIDGRTFVDYVLYSSGIAVPVYVAKDTGLPHTTFVPNHSMILNCA